MLDYRDWGPGFDFAGRVRGTLGLELVDSLSKQLDGRLSHDGKNGFSLNFPLT